MNETKAKIVATTNELFRVHGYNGTSVSQVVAAAGVTTGSIYHFFPGGKRELAQAVIESTGEVYRELFLSIVGAVPDPGAAFATFFEAAAMVLEETDFIDPCPIGTVAREVASTDDALRAVAASAFTSWIDAAAGFLEGHGAPIDDANDLAMMFVGAVEGGFVLSRTLRSAEPMRVAGRRLAPLVESAVAELRCR